LLQTDAEPFLQEFRERLLAQFGLELLAHKTRLIKFGRIAARDREYRGEGKPETFTFSGFTHVCRQLNSRRAFIVWRIRVTKRSLNTHPHLTKGGYFQRVQSQN